MRFLLILLWDTSSQTLCKFQFVTDYFKILQAYTLEQIFTQVWLGLVYLIEYTHDLQS